MRVAIALLALALVMGCLGSAFADVPRTLSYQGVLRDAEGEIVPDDDYDLTFSIYDTLSGGSAIWTEMQTVGVSGGIFNVILGKVSELDIPFDVPYWLGISVEGGVELAPRTELTAAPYALRAAVADSAAVVGAVDDGDWSMGSGNVWRETGYVGIGTTAPDAPLHVRKDHNGLTLFKLENQDTGASSAEVISFAGEEGSANAWIGTYDNDHAAYPSAMVIANNRAGGHLRFHSGGDEKMRLDNSGNLGIGITAPQARLDVSGTARMTSFSMPTGAADGRVLTSDASGVGTWQPAVGGIGGGGATSHFAIFTDPTTIGSSTMTEVGTAITIPDAKGGAPAPETGRKEGELGVRLPARLSVSDQNGWTLYTYLYETDATADGRAALYAYRQRSVRNDGIGYELGSTNNAIVGYNNWGDAYNFGVAGYCYNDYTRTGGVIGAKQDGSYWGALGYKDENSAAWGIYTPNNAYVGGTLNATATNADMLDSQHGAYYQNATNLNAGTVAEARLPQNAIDGSEIEDGTIASADIADGTVASVDILDNTVAAGDILDGTIASVDIGDGAIVNADINASAAITDTKISGTAWTHTGDGYPPVAEYNYGSAFFTTSASYVSVMSQVVTLPAGGYVFAEANAWVGEWDGTYTARIALGFDSTTAESYSERQFSIATDEDECVTATRVYYLAAGDHTVYFLAERIAGAGQVWLPRATLNIIFVDILGKSGETEPRREIQPVLGPEAGVGR